MCNASPDRTSRSPVLRSARTPGCFMIRAFPLSCAAPVRSNKRTSRRICVAGSTQAMRGHARPADRNALRPGKAAPLLLRIRRSDSTGSAPSPSLTIYDCTASAGYRPDPSHGFPGVVRQAHDHGSDGTGERNLAGFAKRQTTGQISHADGGAEVCKSGVPGEASTSLRL